jgi:hypothetical protein
LKAPEAASTKLWRRQEVGLSDKVVLLVIEAGAVKEGLEAAARFGVHEALDVTVSCGVGRRLWRRRQALGSSDE